MENSSVLPVYDLSAAKALEENVIVVGNVRITLLSSRLLRFEKSDEGFTDEPTQGVIRRNFSAVKHEVFTSKDKITIKTDDVSFSIYPDDFKKSYVRFKNGKKASVINDKNLGGTLRTLDTNWDVMVIAGGVLASEISRKTVKLNDGVISQNGVAVYDDSASLVLRDDGENIARGYTREDKYIFAFEHDYRGAVKAFFDISGKAPLIPRFALGNWWSRYHAYTQQEYLDLIDEFCEREIPLSVATVDMDWHYVDVYGKFIKDSGLTDEKTYGSHSGWTGYSWNKELFPDHKAFLKTLHDRGLKVTLNLHPADGVRWFEEKYAEFAKAMDLNRAEKRAIPFDLTDKKFRDAYFNVLHRSLEKDGTDFWWIDWQQGEKSEVAGLDPLWLLNHFHYADSVKNGAGLILSRYCGAGAQRYPLGFSGDTVMSWRFLDYMPYFTATASNIGFGWWSHDIGGHHLGEKDNELMIRWLQFGVFSPINRLHSSNMQTVGKEPWRYDEETCLLMESQLKLRHKLVPYIHTYNHLSARLGRNLCEPVYYAYPEEKSAYRSINEYFFGNEMLVCPITKKGTDGVSYVDAYIPEGFYTDFFTRQNYLSPKGGKTVCLTRGLGSIPVLIKEGSIIPLSADKGNGCENPHDMRVLIFGENGEFTMIEDGGGLSLTDVCETHYRVSESRSSENKAIVKLNVGVSGNKKLIPAKRRVIFEFASAFGGEVVSCRENGKNLAFALKKNGCLKVELEHNGGDLELIIMSEQTARERYGAARSVGELNDGLSRVKEQMLGAVERAQGDNVIKLNLYESLSAAKTKKEFVDILDKATCISKARKAQILELFE